MVSGLKLSDSLDQLALLYLATIQAIALGTRHILEAMNAEGYRIHTLFASGGDTKNPVFVREHADATGCRVVLPAEPEAVLLGAAILGAVAAGDQPSVLAAMGAMNRAGRDRSRPAGGAVAAYFDAKYRVFQRMHDDQLAYRALMEERLMKGFAMVLELPVLWGDMDALRHVNNARYFAWFEAARIAYFDRMRTSPPDRGARRGGPDPRQHELRLPAAGDLPRRRSTWASG